MLKHYDDDVGSGISKYAKSLKVQLKSRYWLFRPKEHSHLSTAYSDVSPHWWNPQSRGDVALPIIFKIVSQTLTNAYVCPVQAKRARKRNWHLTVNSYITLSYHMQPMTLFLSRTWTSWASSSPPVRAQLDTYSPFGQKHYTEEQAMTISSQSHVHWRPQQLIWRSDRSSWAKNKSHCYSNSHVARLFTVGQRHTRI